MKPLYAVCRAAGPRGRTLLRRAAVALLALAAALLVGRGAYADAGDLQDRLARLGKDKHAELVRRGYLIFSDSPRYARRYSGNKLSCTNCHLDGGTRGNAAPMWAAWGEYPAFHAKSDRVVTFEERVQNCFQYSLNGFAPPLDSDELRALVTYAQWVSTGVPVGSNPKGRGFLTVARTGRDPDPMRGKEIYHARCAACHGQRGEGRDAAEPAARVPPLWGHHSYNKGAGLHRIDLMAGFVKANMPIGAPDLTDQQALDVAAWIHLQERWPDPRKGLVRGLVEP